LGPLLILDAQFDQDIEHELLGTISSGTLSTEYYWLDRWYNIFRFSEPTRKLRNFYCNINSPPIFDGRVLSYVDLDIDVLVNPDFSYQILDLEDFEQNSKLFGYPAEVQSRALGAVEELIDLIGARSFPFSEE
jgi:protein associated with RNAse G/E